jgi:3-oxoacyl-[acyl-carrier-protein] synthase I
MINSRITNLSLLHDHRLLNTDHRLLNTDYRIPITEHRLPNTDYRFQMNDVYIAADNIITSLGFSVSENMERMLAGETGIRHWDDQSLSPVPFWASRVDDSRLSKSFSAYGDPKDFSRFEQMVISSVKDALSHASLDISDDKTLFILSTTKGNIDLLNKADKDSGAGNPVYLWQTAGKLQHFLELANSPLIVSNACISGLMAIIVGARMIRAGKYEKVIVTGADLVSEFVLSGFNSFLSLSNGPCRPFDKSRQGLSLGEGAGTVILTSVHHAEDPKHLIRVGYGFSSNDANHISGPSRTGEGLYLAIRKTLEKNKHHVDYISAHGTATPFNDEMESVAITRACLQDIPVNSFKGYWGHTLGAAGIIESIAGIYSLMHNKLIRTMGFSEPGTTHPLAVIDANRKAALNSCLKIASGFGGCNAALLMYK